MRFTLFQGWEKTKKKKNIFHFRTKINTKKKNRKNAEKLLFSSFFSILTRIEKTKSSQTNKSFSLFFIFLLLKKAFSIEKIKFKSQSILSHNFPNDTWRKLFCFLLLFFFHRKNRIKWTNPKLLSIYFKWEFKWKMIFYIKWASYSKKTKRICMYDDWKKGKKKESGMQNNRHK